MVRTIVVPKLGQTEEQATIVRWVKNEGDVIAQGDVLFEIETDKALLEVESFFDGTLLKISVPEGQAVPIQSVVGFIGDPGDPIPEIVAPPALPQKTEAAHALAEAPRQSLPAPAGELAKGRMEKPRLRGRDTRSRKISVPPARACKAGIIQDQSPRSQIGQRKRG